MQCHTHSAGSPALAWRWREARCQHQQMPCTPFLEGPLVFPSPFESIGFCVLLFSMFGLEMPCHFGRFLFICKCWSERAWIWYEEPQGRGLEVYPEWSGPLVWMSSQRVLFFYYFCGFLAVYGAKADTMLHKRWRGHTSIHFCTFKSQTAGVTDNQQINYC